MISFNIARQAALSGTATPAQQRELIEAVKTTNDPIRSWAFEALWKQYERYAFRCVRSYWRGCNEEQDALQEARRNLRRGIEKWDPNRKVDENFHPFTYLKRWIFAGIQRRASTYDAILESPVGALGFGSDTHRSSRQTPEMTLYSGSMDSLEATDKAHDFLAMVHYLNDERLKQIVFRRFVFDETYSEIGTALGCSRERVRQLEKEALAQIKQRLEDDERK